MYWLIAVMTNLVLLATPVTRTSQSASRMDAKQLCGKKSILMNKVSVLEGRSDVAGEAFTYASFIPAGFMTSTRMPPTPGSRLFKAH